MLAWLAVVARRISIKGCSGSGKSRLGRELAQLLGVPWVELDRLHHGPGWQAATAEELQHRVRALIDDADGWVVDGNYDSKLGTLVLDRSQLVIWLDLPLATKLARLSLRSASNWLNDRELWNGNRESLKGWFWGSRSLFLWTVRSHFRDRRKLPAVLAGRPSVRLTTPGEVVSWLNAFRATM